MYIRLETSTCVLFFNLRDVKVTVIDDFFVVDVLCPVDNEPRTYEFLVSDVISVIIDKGDLTGEEF